MLRIDGEYGSAIVFTDDVEPGAYLQIQELLDQPFVKGANVRIMPDVHAGAGCVIGTTMKVVDKVCPTLVGVDVGCGVLVAQLPFGKKDFDAAAFDRIVRRIPAGFSVNDTPFYPDEQAEMLRKLKCFEHIRNIQRIYRSLGTLGGGNHFIEVAANEAGKLYLLIHSGSRNPGTQIAKHYQDVAIGRHSQMLKAAQDTPAKSVSRDKRNNRDLHRMRGKKQGIPDALAYLEGELLADYLNDMRIARRWAARNREVMAEVILGSLTPPLALSSLQVFQTIHNCIDDKKVLRKGAVSAHKGEKLVIPMNMRDGSIIVVRKGNPDWNCSAPHGAGRLMSRREAKRQLDLSEYKRSMEGIYSSTLGKSTIDEAPMAYKPIADIVGAIGGTVEILEHVKPIYNFKSAGD